jgi:hypothetical protein
VFTVGQLVGAHDMCHQLLANLFARQIQASLRSFCKYPEQTKVTQDNLEERSFLSGGY